MQHKLYAVAMLFLIIGGLNWGYVAFTGKDLISYALGKGALTNAIFMFVGLAALSIAFFRDTYLPFLGGTVMPCGILQAQTPEGADTEVRVFVESGAKVMYWAAEPDNKDLKKLQDWREAYISYRNAGVAVADADGYATLKVRRPQSYLVPFKGELQPHIHYRVCHGEGMMSRVKTVTLDGNEYFANPEDEEEFANPDEEDEGFVNPDEEEDFVNPDEEDEGFANPDEEEEFANPDEEDEGFANPDEEEEGYANPDEEEEGYVNPDEEEEFANQEEDDDNFANYGPQEGIPAPSFPANNAIPELNEVAQRTAQRSLMPETGGLLEAPHPAGYDLNTAFAAPAPPKYTAVKYQ